MSKTFQINTKLEITNDEWKETQKIEPFQLCTAVKKGYIVYPIEEPINFIVDKSDCGNIQIKTITWERGKTFIWFMLWIENK
jgi:hypothetical protein